MSALVPYDVPQDPTPEPERICAAGALLPKLPAFPAAAVQVTPVRDGVRLTFARTDGCPTFGVVVAALADLVEREGRDGSCLRFAVEVAPEGATVSLTITGPRALRA